MTAAITVEQLYQLANAKEKKYAKQQAKVEGVSEVEVLMDLLLGSTKMPTKRKEKKPAVRLLGDAWRGWFDGSHDDYSGLCMIGAYLEAPNGREITLSQVCGCGTSAVAEYEALIALLDAAMDAGASRLVVHGDAKAVIDQITGEARTSNRYLRVLRQRVLRIARQFESVEFLWVPRKSNRIADRLASEARSRLEEEGTRLAA